MQTKIMQVQQFDTGDASEVRGQFEIEESAWSWGKDEDGFWVECIEVFDEDYDHLSGTYISDPDLGELLLNVSSLHCADFTKAVITHDNGKKRSISLWG